ncbi:unnamed protein product, partial [Closterium sp. NIES-54]
AAGSTLACRLTNLIVKDALSLAGLKDISAATVLPVATGMALTLTLLALKASRPAAQYVLWSRIDQKTCLKCILTAGLSPVVVPLHKQGDQLWTDLAAMEQGIHSRGADSILCVLSTTSCFAPRAPDNVEAIARLCHRLSIPHVINNAYGVQSAAISAAITRAWRRGRVDAVVQSTDKNFLVPVGGAVVAGGPGRSTLVNAVNASYPGRASISPILDVFITLLSLGASGWQALLQGREELFPYLREKMRGVAERHGERLLQSPDNPISLAISLSSFVPAHARADVACAAADSAPPAMSTPAGAAAADVAGSEPSLATTVETSEKLAASVLLAPSAAPPPVALPPAAAATAAAAGVKQRETFDSGEQTSSPAAAPTESAPPPPKPPPATAAAAGVELRETFDSRQLTIPPGAAAPPATAASLASPLSIPPTQAPASLRDPSIKTSTPSTPPPHTSSTPPPHTSSTPPPHASPTPIPSAEATSTITTQAETTKAPLKSPPQAPPITFLGSMLFSRFVSGCRVVPQGVKQTIGGVALQGFGSSYD